jgi:hypothetical protein
MSEHYPRIRRYTQGEGEPWLFFRECVSITFYMRHSHVEIAHAVMRALEAYCRTVGSQALGWYTDEEGCWRDLDEQGWKITRQDLLHPSGACIALTGASSDLTGYEFIYRGRQLDATDPGETSMVAFFLPTEYLEEHGPNRVRELALELGAGLPFSFGYASLSYLFPEAHLHASRPARKDCFRYPGIEIPDSYVSLSIGTRVRGAYWLTFLGQPVLGELGGAAGLRARLRSPGTTVQEMEGEQAVVTLGTWPEAGDMEQGRPLPEYRELARVLEPWLYQNDACWDDFSWEDMRRWERRFLD